MPPKIPLVRTSERLTYTRCLQSWWWSYVDHLRPAVEAPPLRFGTLIHKALELRYPVGVKRGPHPAETFVDLYDEELDAKGALGFYDSDGSWADARDLGIAMLEGYVDTYGEDEEWEVIASEQQFKVPVRDGRRRPLCFAVGTFDGVWRNRRDGRVYLNDYKTAKTIWDQHLILDEQTSSYWAFATPWLRRTGVLRPDEDLEGLLFTFLRKAPPDPRPRNESGLYLNKDGSVSKVQPAPLFKRVPTYRSAKDREMVLERFRAQVTEMLARRRGELGLYKEPGRNSCTMCSFRDMCEVHEAGGNWKMIREATMIEWDPYSDHEINEEGK